MKSVYVQLMGGDLIHAYGEVLLDTEGGSLIVHAQDGALLNFTRANIWYFTVTDAPEGATQEDE